MVSRRTVLGALGVAGLAAAGLALDDRAPFGESLRHALGVAGPVPAPKRAVVKAERVWSRYRGREVELLTLVPPGVGTRGLPMSILLHGRYGSAGYAAVGGLPEALVAAVSRGSVSPFGFVAVDGGDNYWHENVPGDDPLAMLLEEIPQWLSERGFGPVFAATGTSMGGFGALLYARRRHERREPLKAVATLAPALMTSWDEMRTRNAFADEAQWASLDPLRNLRAHGDVPVGVWVGDKDWFIEGTRRFIAATKPAVATIVPGGAHDDSTYRKVVPDVIRFLGRRLP
ncbi:MULTISPECIES: alpha/beta hydrolase [unclassified Saccharothrix]|uniref:alpha/beta hydrolase n=1 Tax=unclassified Saccharothrix TaxID=2593673 RepID=UPI00307D2B60